MHNSLYGFDLLNGQCHRKQFEKINAVAGDAARTAALRGRVAAVKLNAFESVTQIREMVVAYELLHDIPERWTPDCEEWKSAAKYTKVRDFQKALDKLEALVVQRLFELSKMGLAGTGEEIACRSNCILKIVPQDIKCGYISTKASRHAAKRSRML